MKLIMPLAVLRPSRLLAPLVAAFALTACGPYAHENPYDPAADVQITIHGADTLRSLGERTQFTAEVLPSWSGVDPRWQSTDSTLLVPQGGGWFQGWENGSALVVASVGDHYATHQIVVRQRPWRAAVACYLVVSCLTLSAVDQIGTISATQTDSIGRAVSGVPLSSVQYTSRDPGVVAVYEEQPTFVRVRAVGNGTTYVVSSLAGHLDSARVTVNAP